jgi:hypothetical protein
MMFFVISADTGDQLSDPSADAGRERRRHR